MNALRWTLILLLAIIIGVLFFAIPTSEETFKLGDLSFHFFEPSTTNASYNHHVCIVQIPEPWHSSILSLFPNSSRDYSLPIISEGTPIVTSYKDGLLQIIKENFSCMYRCFEMDTMYKNKYFDWISFQHEVRTTCEFIDVACDWNITGTQNTTATPPKNPAYRMAYAQAIKKVNGTQRSLEPYRPSVLILVVDSMSHSAARRRLPKTLQFLHNNFNTTEFNGYAKVGTNSNPNAAAFLAGIMAEADDGKTDDSSEGRIQSKSIWNDFKKRGFITYFSEDDIVNQLFGFKSQPPGHHYLRAWPHASHRVSMTYVSQLLQIYKDYQLFTLNWMSYMSHDQVNDLDDDFFVDFFNKSQEYLKDTCVILMGDHGLRLGELRSTEIGRMEDNLPFFSISLPEKLRNNTDLITNLHANSKILTNHFDLFATLWDLLATDFKNFSKQPNWPDISSSIVRGQSLLRPIKNDRTCESTKIPFQYCPCQETSASVNDLNLSKKLANHIVQHMNNAIPLDKCAKIFLDEIVETGEIIHQSKKDTNLYRITIKTEPNRAIFQVFLKKESNSDKINIVGQINRLNRYGNLSSCINHHTLKTYCSCK